MRRDKELIYKLRKEGLSYRAIQEKTGVSRATLTAWFGTMPWSKELKALHVNQDRIKAKERMQKLNMVRSLKGTYQQALTKHQAKNDYQEYKKDPLFWTGLMIYTNHGDMKSRGSIRMTSSKYHLHRQFFLFLGTYLDIPKESIRIALSIGSFVSKEREEGTRETWAKEVDIPLQQFYKTQYIRSSVVTRVLQNGIGMTILTSIERKTKLLTWLALSQNEYSDDAGMV